MKRLRLIETDETSYFVLDRSGQSIMCAFNTDRKCSPTCAACNVSGSNPKAFCSRGEKDEFTIGWIKETENPAD